MCEFFFTHSLYLCNHRQIDGLAPTFVKKPAIRQEDDGKRLLFECLIKADPMPQVRWSHNGSEVNDDARHKVFAYFALNISHYRLQIEFLPLSQLSVQKEGQQYFAALEIKNVTVEDAGKYKVTAKNELGESNATITLNFDSKFKLILFYFAHSILDFKKEAQTNIFFRLIDE